MIDSLAVGGAERSLVAIAQNLRRWHPHFVVLYAGDALRHELLAARVPVTCFHETRRYAFTKCARRLRTLIATLRPDVIHSTLFRADVVARLAVAGGGSPSLISSFVNDSYASARYKKLRGLPVVKLCGVQMIDAATAGLTTTFVANSRAIAESNARALGISSERIHVIHRGRDLTKYRPPENEEERNALKARFGFGNGPVIVNVSRLLPRKGHLRLLDAFAPLAPRARLVFVGDGPERVSIEHHIRKLGIEQSVSVLGTRHDVDELLRAADVFAFPSEYEGFPGALIEAMASGLLCLASDIPMNREAIVHGESGILVAPGEWEAALRRAIEAPDARLGAHARMRAQTAFEIGQIARLHESLYDQVCENGTWVRDV